jgi:hypothetical protein
MKAHNLQVFMKCCAMLPINMKKIDVEFFKVLFYDFETLDWKL